MGGTTGAVTVRPVTAGVSLLELTGPLDAAAENLLLDAHAQTLREGAHTILLNFAGVTHIDGAGVTCLVMLCCWAKQKEQRLRAFGLPLRCRRIFEDLGLNLAITFHTSERMALRAVGASAPAGEATGESIGETAEACRAENWAERLGRASRPQVPEGFYGLNVEDRPVLGPLAGFGQLWHKIYWVRLSGVEITPEELIATCKGKLGEFWPEGNRLYVPTPGIVPGAVGLIDITMPGGAPLSTGVRVAYVNDRSFTFVTLAGHLEAGWITFSAREDAGCTVFQVASLARTADPAYEVGFVLFGHAQQERFWRGTLNNLAQHFGVPAQVQARKTCLDAHRNWSSVTNVWQNAGARTALYAAGGLVSRLLRGRKGRST
jgi:anti-anti-sigma regulatory factor